MPRPMRTIEQCKEGFLRKTEIKGDCFMWKGNKSETGYGRFYFENKVQKAHRVSFKLFKGDIPLGKLILHKCNNRLCVNPRHLYAGNHKDNFNDGIKAGTIKISQCGENNHNHKLTKEQVNEIRNIYKSGELECSKIGELFDVSRKNISYIIHNQTWKN